MTFGSFVPRTHHPILSIARWPIMRTVGCVLILIGLMAPHAAANPLLNVQLLRPSPHANDLVSVRTSDVPEGNFWSATTLFSFSKNPLVFVSDDSTRRRHAVVGEQLSMDIMGGYSILGWVNLAISLPVFLLNEGDGPDGFADPDPYASMGLGDLRLSPKFRIVARDKDANGFGLSIDGLLTFPTGDPDGFVSDGFAIQPSLIADIRWGPLLLAVNAGARIRDPATYTISDINGDEQQILNVHHEFEWRAGAALRLVGETLSLVSSDGFQLTVLAEAYGATSDFTNNNSNMEFLAAAQFYLADYGINFSFGGGSGVISGYGSTKFRLFAGGGYTPPGPRDEDGDTFLDEVDKCPLEPEDFDDHQDDDGCPDPDNDGDGLADEVDRCPFDPEDDDGHQDGDGCPELDNDGDGILDSRDKCGDKAEDMDGFQDEDGCPELDNDNDGVPDLADRCPTVKESRNGYQDDDGCPDTSLASVSSNLIVLQNPIDFHRKRAKIQSQSLPVIRAVAGIIRVRTEVKKVKIIVRAKSMPTGTANIELSQQRAESVMTILQNNGVAPERLEAVGIGAKKHSSEIAAADRPAANKDIRFVIVVE